MKLAAEIEEIRDAQGLSQRDLAKLAGVSQSKLNRALNHEDADINVNTLIRIADALNRELKLVPRPKSKS